MCKQQKCNSEVGSYLAKSFYLATKTTLRMEHGCVAEPGKTLDFTEIRGYSGAHRGELIAWAVPVLANNFWKGGGGRPLQRRWRDARHQDGYGLGRGCPFPCKFSKVFIEMV